MGKVGRGCSFVIVGVAFVVAGAAGQGSPPSPLPSRVSIQPRHIALEATIPARFPDPARPIGLLYECGDDELYLSPSSQLSGVTEARAVEWFNLVKPTFKKGSVAFANLEVGCDNGRYWVRAKTMAQLVGLLKGGKVEGRTYEDQGTKLQLRVCPASPNCSRLTVERGTLYPSPRIAGLEQGEGELVAFLQGAGAKPVVFEGKDYEVKFDPTKPFTVYMKELWGGLFGQYQDTGIWHKVVVRYDEGYLSWWADEQGPPR